MGNICDHHVIPDSYCRRGHTPLRCGEPALAKKKASFQVHFNRLDTYTGTFHAPTSKGKEEIKKIPTK